MEEKMIDNRTVGKRKVRNKSKIDGKSSESNGRVELDARTVNENCERCDDVEVLPLDYSVENHFKAMESISKLCGEVEPKSRKDDSDLARLSSKITFLREFRDFNYGPRDIKFSGGKRSTGQDTAKRVTLQHFSSAAVPKENKPSAGTSSTKLSRDFVMYVGGPVWALDWCPRSHETSSSQFKSEFIAVAAHPPGSSYHKLGAPLSGRGAIQIWCIVNINGNEEERPFTGKLKKRRTKDDAGNELQPKKPKGRPRKKPSQEFHQLKKPAGRPRKKLLEGTSNDLNEDSLIVPALAVQSPEDTVELVTPSGVSEIEDGHLMHNVSHEKGESSATAGSLTDPVLRSFKRRRLKKTAVDGCQDDKLMTSPIENVDSGSSLTDQEGKSYLVKDTAENYSLAKNSSVDTCSDCFVPKDVALPRLVLCLAHNGKVAWDVKWKPSNIHEPKCIHRLGYLAVLLGNGSLEVWEVPRLHTMKVIYSSARRENTDPRFVKLDPVFRCSMIKSGGIQSIPLTLEWSTSPLNEHLLVGCHDGTVAMWKFSVGDSSKDTRPLLCFTADTVPIRALAWAPCGSDPESANVVLTAGHGGIKFWDLRDLFRPLWGVQPVLKNIYSLDWLLDPSCIMLSLDDGTLKMLSLSKIAYDVPVTGKNFAAKKPLRLHTIYCSSFAIWCVQISRATGLVAYASADGDVLHFELTAKAVEKDPSRHRTPHYMCLSLDEEESAIIIHPPSDIPITVKKSLHSGAQPNSVPGLSNNSCSKKANGKDSKLASEDSPNLALCYGEGPTSESGLDESMGPFGRKVKKKVKPANKTKSEADPQLASIDEATVLHPPSDISITANKSLNPGGQQNLVPGLLGNSCPKANGEDSKLTSEDALPLAFSFGDGPPLEIGLDETLESFRRKLKKKAKHAKRTKSKVDPPPASIREAAPISADEPLLALCYWNGSTTAMGSDGSSLSDNIKKKNNKKAEADNTLAAADEATEPLAYGNEEPQAIPKKTGEAEAGSIVHTFPSKLVAMHRVRWNTNKGSERWLCSGGAAGIVHCQEIVND